MTNEWTFAGEVVKIKEHTSYDSGATLTVRGIARRVNNESQNIVEIPMILPPNIWNKLCEEGIKAYSILECKGHFETFIKVAEDSYNIRQRTNHVVDSAKILKH